MALDIRHVTSCTRIGGLSTRRNTSAAHAIEFELLLTAFFCESVQLGQLGLFLVFAFLAQFCGGFAALLSYHERGRIIVVFRIVLFLGG